MPLKRLRVINQSILTWVAGPIKEHADVWCISAGLVALAWVLQSHIDFNISDEGFLWYGSWRVSNGEVPIRDFNSYDPGRYYWTAMWSLLFGDGVIGNRAAVALFQIIGLALGLLAARRVLHGRWQLFLVGLLLFVWMWPRNRLFESGLAMCAVFIGTRLIEKPNRARLWQAGMYIGLAAFFGRNHGLFSLIGTLGVVLMLAWQGKQKFLLSFAHVLCAIPAGYLPMIVLMLLSRGLATAFIRSVLSMFNRGATNLPLSVPWPWTVQIAAQDWLTTTHQLSLGVCFMILFALPVFAIALVMLRTSRGLVCHPLLSAAAFMSLTYAYHATVRSDVSHLSEAIHPALLGTVAFIAMYDGRARGSVRAASAITLAILTVFVAAYKQPLASKVRRSDLYVEEYVRGDRLWIQRYDAMVLAAMRDRIAPDLEPGEQVFFAPNMSGLYAALERRSPVWDTYPLWPALPGQQERMIEELERAPVKYAVINDTALDGNDSLRFRNTYPAVWIYLLGHFDIVDNNSTVPNYITLRRRP